ncbi:glycosyltransferase family 50 protein [Cantharellus anzutake]|uniref:glycosyltransferase family 50 protein n=1 Tax=Cantharellus anzutake TaxID=1750568 RepID=UPI00190763ED|nr:glycosyltransferase family 50 protein [Cantharellus anzutake]KAF8343989.1 glycosyltransferase family 50 protein [Cantharellus anzutake]
MRLEHVTFKHVVFLGVLLRAVLIVYGMYHDSHAALKYTDVDYRVFSDAARFIVTPGARGSGHVHGSAKGCPYNRETYRYTPLLAILMIPNEVIHHTFGKVLFAACDILIGYILYCLPTNGTSMRDKVWWIAALWLLNPMPANISTRGSAESVLGLFVISTLALAKSGRLDAAAISLGLAVHFKIYPFIYGASLLAFIHTRAKTKLGNAEQAKSSKEDGTRALLSIFDTWTLLAQARFTLISFGSFAILNIFMYLIWGQPFLEHSYLYHLTRKDHRHNFSLYFYPTYLTYSQPRSSSMAHYLSPRNALLSFIPQMVLSIGSGFLFGGKDIALAWFIQTVCFVHFNRVCTSQYFMWYMWFLPIILPRVKLSKLRATALLAIWISAQALWLSIAYRLEFLGQDVFLPLWLSSILFLFANCYVLVELVKAYR